MCILDNKDFIDEEGNELPDKTKHRTDYIEKNWDNYL